MRYSIRIYIMKFIMSVNCYCLRFTAALMYSVVFVPVWGHYHKLRNICTTSSTSSDITGRGTVTTQICDSRQIAAALQPDTAAVAE
jgi:hypothetical protein